MRRRRRSWPTARLLRASEVASPRSGDQLTVSGEAFVVQGEPEWRDPDRLVWSLDVKPA